MFNCFANKNTHYNIYRLSHKFPKLYYLYI